MRRARSTRTSVIPQAYITATSVRNRLQIGSSEQINSCFSHSNANNTRVETGGRPCVLGLRVALGERAVNGRDQGHLRNCLGPLADGMHFGDEVYHLEARSASGQPMLQVS